MNEIKVGTVAFLKSTEEPCFVLKIEEGAPHVTFPDLSKQVATVRRPSQGRDGVRHHVEIFAIEELETLETKQSRQIGEMEELKARFRPDAPATNQGQLFLSN